MSVVPEEQTIDHDADSGDNLIEGLGNLLEGKQRDAVENMKKGTADITDVLAMFVPLEHERRESDGAQTPLTPVAVDKPGQNPLTDIKEQEDDEDLQTEQKKKEAVSQSEKRLNSLCCALGACGLASRC